MNLIMRSRRLHFQEHVVPKSHVTGTVPSRAWRPRFEADPSEFTLITHPDETFISPEPPAHPGVTTLFAPADGVTTSLLDPRRFESDALDPSNLENIKPDAHEAEIMISASNREMPPEGTLLAVPSIITMEIG